MTDFGIRRATPFDVDAVLRFWHEAAEGISITDDQEGVARLISRDPDALLLAEQHGRIAGTVIAGFDGWRCSVYRLAVRPDCRRQGIATALMDAAERRFLTLGGRRIGAMVLESNERAHHTWGSADYHREDRWRRWVKSL